MFRIKIRPGSISSSIRTVQEGKFPWWLGLLFAVIGAAVLWFSYQEHLESEELRQHGVQTEAVVTDIRKHERHNSGRKHRSKTVTYHPVVTYTDDRGITRTAESPVGVSSRTAYSKGDTVRVVYLPHKPQEIELTELSGSSSHYIFMAVGGLFFIVGIGLTIYGLKKRNRHDCDKGEFA